MFHLVLVNNNNIKFRIRSLVLKILFINFTGNPQPQRYFSPNHSLPPHSLPSHVRPSYHSPNVSVATGHRQQPIPNVTTSSSHLTHPMYM